jgi:hypothetical protein
MSYYKILKCNMETQDVDVIHREYDFTKAIALMLVYSAWSGDTARYFVVPDFISTDKYEY